MGVFFLKYSVWYYFGDNLKGKFHDGFIDLYDFNIYFIRDDKSSIALNKVVDCYLINIPKYEKCIKLYCNDFILNIIVVDSVFWGLFSSPNFSKTDYLYKKIVHKNRIGVYKKYIY